MTKRIWALAFITLHAFQLFYPSVSWADSGAADAGVPLPHEQLVDLSTGDFSYSIPLFELEGYPVTLNYKAGIQLEQQASWVGLGWSLSPGGISRQVRGVPDDFRGDLMLTSFNRRDNKTYGGGTTTGVELTGKVDPVFFNLGLSYSLDFMYNNYTGIGFTVGHSFSNKMGTSIGPYANYSAYSVNKSIGNQSGLTKNINVTSGQSIGLGPVSFDYSRGKSTNYNSIRGYEIDSEFESRQLTTLIPVISGRIKSSTFNSRSVSFTPITASGVRGSSFSINGGAGVSIAILYAYKRWRYNQMIDRLKEVDKINPAFGYINSQKIPENLRNVSVMDYNRENTRVITPEVTVLPFSYTTEDRYFISSINGGGQFKAKRSDIGSYHIADAKSESSGKGVGAELGIGIPLRIADNKTTNRSDAMDGEWKQPNPISNLEFHEQEINSAFEPYFYEMAGELNATTPAYEDFNKDHAVRFDIQKFGTDYFPTTKLVSTDRTNHQLPTVDKTYRKSRRTVIEDITVEEATAKAFHKQVDYFDASGTPSQTTRLLHSNSMENHISEFQVTRSNGMREYYSTPVYNRTKKEVQFNVEGNNYDLARGLVAYTSQDASKGNTKGTTRFFQSSTTPDYAEEFLLNSIVSEDYEDRTGDGPTVDDIGNYTHFSYQREHPNFKWRMPYQQNLALFDPQMRAQTRDDQGSYVYGEKEKWYLKEMNSKHLVAEFILNDKSITAEQRQDAHGVLGEHGGLDVAQQSRYLKEIKIYSAEDKAANTTNAKPLKTIQFTYDYSLCKGTPDNKNTGTAQVSKSGKLTLTEVTILDHVSQTRENKVYMFNYGNNPDYEVNAKDNWGYYKENLAVGISDAINSPGYHSMAHLPNDEFPYRSQDKATADLAASAWSLDQISTPEGSDIVIDYESDTYGYVQDKRASRMYSVAGFMNSETGAISNHLYDAKDKPRAWMLVNLGNDGTPESSSIANDNEQFRKEYLGYTGGKNRLRNILYKFLVHIKDDRYEQVVGYARADFKIAKVVPTSVVNGRYTQALIPITADNDPNTIYTTFLGDGVINPISRRAWQVAADELTRYIIPGSDVGEINVPDNISQIPSAIIDVAKQVISVLQGMKEQSRMASKGYYRYMAESNVGKRFKPNRSFVKLQDPNQQVFGGGHRVKSLSVSDGWGPYTESYTIAYDYTDRTQLTTGVTSNEPIHGDEANNLFEEQMGLLQAVRSTYNRTKFDYVVTPLGKNVLPESRVVYAKVKEQRVAKPGVSDKTIAYKEAEFYTAKDYPLRFESTDLKKFTDDVTDDVQWDYNNREVKMAVSQGHSLVMNDMHGKTKSITLRSPNSGINTPVYSEEYIYQSVAYDRNKLRVSSPNGTAFEYSGIDVSVCIDWREHASLSTHKEKQYNRDIIPIPVITPLGSFIIPVPIISKFEYNDRTFNELKQVTVSKVVEKWAIVDRIEYNHNGIKSFYNPRVYDAESRQPIVTLSKNYMENPALLNVDYPAYWHEPYAALGAAHHQVGRVYDGQVLDADDRIIEPSLQVLGTECYIEFYNASTQALISANKYWVSYGRGLSDPDLGTGEGYVFINREGDLMVNPANTTLKIDVVRSGYSNRPDLAAQQIQSLQAGNPGSPSYHAQTSWSNVITASATEYTDEGETYISPFPMGSCLALPGNLDNNPPYVKRLGKKINPFLFGIKGSWHPQKGYSYDTDRAYASTLGTAGAVNLRTDGTYSCSPFYYVSNNKLVKKSDRATYWNKETEATRYLANAGITEQVDKQGLFNASTLGYGAEVPLSSAVNARRGDIYFESFEDNNTSLGTNWYQSEVLYANGVWLNGSNMVIPPPLVTSQSHSGSNALQLNGAQSVKLLGYIYESDMDTITMDAPLLLDTNMIDVGYQRDAGDTRDIMVSFWVKRAAQQLPYTMAGGILSVEDDCATHTSPTKYYESGIIDGWKQVKFIVDGTGLDQTGIFKIAFNNTYSGTMYIDDVKIEPLESEHVATTVERIYGRMVNELDPANFGTEYRYNESGQVSNVLRETENGKVSISSSEARFNN